MRKVPAALRRMSVGVAAVAALLAVGCTETAPTSPDELEVPVFFHRGNATLDLGHFMDKGWMCFNVEGLGVHCFSPGALSSPASISILVFDTDDPTDMDAPLLGSEILIRADLYAGQPCPTEGGGEYAFLPATATGLPADYRACHHYSHDD